MLDLAGARVYAIPLRTRFRGITVREGMLIEGPNGWGEFCPFPEYSDAESAAWLATAVEQASGDWPAPVRTQIPVNCTVPAVSPERAHEIAASSGCTTAKIKVADHPSSLPEDIARVEAVRAALGPSGKIRVDANAVWDIPAAVRHIKALDRAASGLEYVEQPCRTIEELASVRRKVNVPIAADESIRRADDPMKVAVAGAADIAVIKCTPLGGVHRALAVASAAGLPCVVSSALETSIGLHAQLALAASLPSLDFACGLGTISLFQGDLVPTPLLPANGHINLPATPQVPIPDQFSATDPHRIAWWHARLQRVAAILGITP
jgi:o-succinylbenzoate synthase